jgi:catecholate siderophore receptor
MKPQPITRTKSSAREMLALTALLASGSAVAAETPAQPQDTSADQKQEGETQTLGEMVVEAIRDSLYKPEKLQSPKFTAPLRDIPQTITVVPKEVIKEQNAATLRDVLRNVPGISMQAGEGQRRQHDDPRFQRSHRPLRRRRS